MDDSTNFSENLTDKERLSYEAIKHHYRALAGRGLINKRDVGLILFGMRLAANPNYHVAPCQIDTFFRENKKARAMAGGDQIIAIPPPPPKI